MSRPWFDDKEQIATRVRTLADFHTFIQRRRDWSYVREKSLRGEFCLFGRWMFDSCGNCGSVFVNDEQWPRPLKDLYPYIPDFLTRSQMGAFLALHGKEDWSVGSNADIPSPFVVCPECNEGWTLRTCHDSILHRVTEYIPLRADQGRTLKEAREAYERTPHAVYQLSNSKDHMICNPNYADLTEEIPYEGAKPRPRNPHGWIGTDDNRVNDAYVIQPGDVGYFNIVTYRHVHCYVRYLTREMEKEFHSALVRAGFQNFSMTPISNKYGSLRYHGPWFHISLDGGGELVIGWRKRVINVDFSKTGFQGDITDGDNTDKGNSYVHAWGYEKLAAYLTNLRRQLSMVKN